jgi:hypothetical protein
VVLHEHALAAMDEHRFADAVGLCRRAIEALSADGGPADDSGDDRRQRPAPGPAWTPAGIAVQARFSVASGPSVSIVTDRRTWCRPQDVSKDRGGL